MAPTAAAAAWEADSSSAPSGVVQLLLRNIDSRTTVVRAQLEDTLDSVLKRLSNTVHLRVVYAGRCLRREATISELGLPQDATLHVTYRLLSTRPLHNDAWNLASEVATAAGQPVSAASLDGLVGKFLNVSRASSKEESSNPLGPFADHMAIFLHSGAPGVLGKLYLSKDQACRVGAERAIRRFITSDPETEEPSMVKALTAPVLLELSRSIATGASQADQLYTDLRCTLAAVLSDPKWNPAYWLDLSPKWVAEQLTRFAVEKAKAVMGHIAGAYLMLTADKKNLAEFKIFSSVLRQQVLGLDADTPRGPWRTALYEMLISLLRTVDEYLAMIETFLRRRMNAASSGAPLNWMASLPCVSDVLAELDAWSSMDEWPEIRSALRATLAVATRVLVLVAGTEWCQNIGWITRHRDLLDFESRRSLAMTMLPKLATTRHEILIDRSRLLADSFGYIAHATPEKLLADLLVEFRNEHATGPGVRREWFSMVFQALFNPRQVLFSACPSDRRRFFVNPTSVVDPLHLQYYEFAGRMIALALTHNIPVGVLLDRTLFLQLADRPVTLDDIADADPSLHASCKMILEMDPSLVDSNALGLTFVRDVELFGSRTVAELVPGGKDVAVDSNNRSEFVRLLIQDSFVSCSTNQVAYLSRGFSSMLGNSELSKHFFDALDVEDFNLMLGGSKDTIDVEEWKAHTDYHGYSRKSRQVKWFWEAVKAMTVEQRRRLLFFWTSVEYLPLDGFSGLGSRLTIFRSPNSCEHLPTSGTCFYQLNLPAYTSLDVMQIRLQMIVQEHVCRSFGKS